MELLFIRRKIWLDDFCDFEDELPRDVTAHHIEYAKVYKQDSKSSGLVDTKSIGDHALSVGYNNALCLPATSGIEKNCIYYTDDYDDGIFGVAESKGGFDMGVFSLDDGSIQPHYPGVSKSKFSLPIWIDPNQRWSFFSCNL